MRSTHVLDRLPLFIEGDLPESELDSIQAHLAVCDTCRQVALAFRESQAWVKGAPELPFEEADYDRLRQNVIAQIQESEARGAGKVRPFMLKAWPPLLLAAGALAIVFTRSSLRPPSASTPATTAVPTPPSHAPSIAAIPGPASTLPKPGPVQARLQSKSLPPQVITPAEGGPARIELQTSNPQIRIIWLARALPAPDPVNSINDPS